MKEQPEIFNSVKRLVEKIVRNKDKKLLAQALQGMHLPYRTVEEEPAYFLFRGCLLADLGHDDNFLLSRLTADLIREIAKNSSCSDGVKPSLLNTDVSYSYAYNTFLFSTYLVKEESLFKELLFFFKKGFHKEIFKQGITDISFMLRKALIYQQTDQTMKRFCFDLIENNRLVTAMDDDELERREGNIFDAWIGLLEMPTNKKDSAFGITTPVSLRESTNNFA